MVLVMKDEPSPKGALVVWVQYAVNRPLPRADSTHADVLQCFGNRLLHLLGGLRPACAVEQIELNGIKSNESETNQIRWNRFEQNGQLQIK